MFMKIKDFKSHCECQNTNTTKECTLFSTTTKKQLYSQNRNIIDTTWTNNNEISFINCHENWKLKKFQIHNSNWTDDNISATIYCWHWFMSMMLLLNHRWNPELILVQNWMKICTIIFLFPPKKGIHIITIINHNNVGVWKILALFSLFTNHQIN